MERPPLATFITVIMNALFLLAVVLTARLVVLFFGALSQQDWASRFLDITSLLTLPLGIDAIKTPYGGAFDVSAALTILVVLVAEWVLSMFRGRTR